MITTARQVLRLFTREGRGRWLLLIAIAVVVSGVEMLGAALVYVLLGLVADPSGSIDLPVVGNVRALFPRTDQQTLVLATIATMAVFFLGRGGLRVGAAYVQSRVAHNAGARLSARLVEGYLRAPYAMHLRRSSSELIRNGHQAVSDAVRQVVIPLVRVLAEALIVIGLLALLATIAPLATLVAIAVVGGGATLLLVVVQPRLKSLGSLAHEESRTSLKALQESFHGIRDVKILGKERSFAGRYARSRVRLARVSYLRSTIEQLPPIVMETALLAFILLFFTIVLVRGGELLDALSTLGLFAYAGLRMQPSLQRIVGGMNSLRFATTPIRDLDADLRAIEAVRTTESDLAPLPFRQELRFEDVCFRYDGAEHAALREVNLVIRPGDQIGICGPTGGGKTTLVDLLTGLLEPTEGRVLVDGVAIHGRERSWQQNLGVVPQMVFLIDDTLRSNIALGVPPLDIDEDAVHEAVALAQLTDVIAALPHGLDTVVGERGVRLSGGQRQRLAIARALYRQPSVLVFDEGTSALDNVTEADMVQAIRGLRGDRTVIFVAHRLTTVRDSDQLIFVEGGRIGGIGKYEDLAREVPSFGALVRATG